MNGNKNDTEKKLIEEHHLESKKKSNAYKLKLHLPLHDLMKLIGNSLYCTWQIGSKWIPARTYTYFNYNWMFFLLLHTAISVHFSHTMDYKASQVMSWNLFAFGKEMKTLLKGTICFDCTLFQRRWFFPKKYAFNESGWITYTRNFKSTIHHHWCKTFVEFQQ